MRRRSPRLLSFFAVLGCATLVQPVFAQGPGYPAGGHYAGGVVPAGGAHMAPPLPASPLAGGIPAAQGQAFMDAHGRSVVMPTSYCAPGGGTCYSGGMGGIGGAYGDPMAVDFGSYPREQCGPHYFDVAFETVFLKMEDLPGEGLSSFTSIGVVDPNDPFDPSLFRLNPSGEGDDYEGGWRVALRYDIGPLALVEATYTGLYDFGYDLVAVSDTNQLFSIYSNFGNIDEGGDGITGIPGLDEASQHNLRYESDLQSTELSYRRYWVGLHPSISGTYLLGARYTRLTEDFVFSAITDNGNGSIGTFTENDLVGFQFGGDGTICLRQGLRLGMSGKVGVYNNRFKFNANIANIPTTPLNQQPDEDGDQVAFVADGGVKLVADILSSWSLTTGYEFLYVNSVVTVQGNVNTAIFDDSVAGPPALHTQGHVFYHGFNCGLEYIW